MQNTSLARGGGPGSPLAQVMVHALGRALRTDPLSGLGNL